MTGPDLVLVGERVALGPLREDLAPTYARWANDLEVRFGLEHLGIATPESDLTWVQETVRKGAGHEPESVAFTVYERADLEPVGTSTLFEISHLHASATFGIALGARRGQGLGTEATRLVLDWGFHVLGLQNVLLEVQAWNAPAIRAYEKAGFRLVGRRRGAAMSRGRRWDVVMMDALPEDLGGSRLAGHVAALPGHARPS
jgi:RimJ/RimL family protein N-acetyltransferase